MTLYPNPEHLTAKHLFSVENLDIDEKHRKKTLLPGHMAETFIWSRSYKVLYFGKNDHRPVSLED